MSTKKRPPKKADENHGLMEKIKSEPIALGSVVISIVAGVISYFSFQTSNDAYQLAKNQYQEERSLILVATFDTKGSDVMVVKPVEAGFNYLGGQITWPTNIDGGPQPVEPSGKVWGMAWAAPSIQKFVQAKYHPLKDTSLYLELSVPVIIESHYTIKGLGYTDKSLYTILVKTLISEKGVGEIEFNSLVFSGHAQEPLDQHSIDVMFEKKNPPKL